MLQKLPPKRDQIESVAILKADSKASRALGELKGIARSIPNQSILINAVVLQEAKDSSEIENIITTQDELYKALSTDQKVAPEAKEVVNYREALFLGFYLVKDNGFLRLTDILSIQQVIIENNAGLRKVAGTTLKNDKTNEVVYMPPQHIDEINDLMANFLDHFNKRDKEVSPLINLAVLHYQFESIHPFYDGNGRTGRILNLLYLLLNELIDIPILYLSSYIIEHKADYYRLFTHVQQTGEWESLVIFMLNAIEETSNRTIAKIQEIDGLLKEVVDNVKIGAPKVYSKELVELIFELPYSKTEYVVNRLGLERKAAARYLKTLEDIGVLESIKVGREMIYINTRLVEVLKG